MKTSKPKVKKTPESKFLDVLKGQKVSVIKKRDGMSLTATLLWVDRYSVGLKFKDGRETMFFKHAIEELGKS